MCMFEELARAIRELEPPGDGAGLAQVIALRDQLDATVSGFVADFDADTQWAYDGAVSMTGWLTTHTGLSRGRAHHMTHMAGRLHRLPVTAAVWFLKNGRS